MMMMPLALVHTVLAVAIMALALGASTAHAGWIKDIKIHGAGATTVAEHDDVTVHAIGYVLSDDKRLTQFWSTRVPGGRPFGFKAGVGAVIRGWDEAVLTMLPGERARVTMTYDYAYGYAGFPAWGIGSNQNLVFDVEVLSVNGVVAAKTTVL